MYMDVRGVMVKFPHVVQSNMALREALFFMKECNIRHLPVVEDKKLIGVISERDVLSYEGWDQGNEIIVGDVMSRSPFIVNQHAPLVGAISTMAKEKYGSVLVVDGQDHLVGIFTTIDALKLLESLLTEDDKSVLSFKNIFEKKSVVGWI